jgi:hypothetical protein
LKLKVTKYEWAVGTADIDINIFSSVTPTITRDDVDLYDYYIKDTMGDISYSFEDINTDNTLYTTASNVTFDCINDIYNDTVLTEYFGCYESNKYVKWKVDYYNDDNEIIDKFILYKDGINIDSIENQILSFTILGYEKEFKSYFDNVPLIDSNFTNIGSGYNGLEWYYLNNVLKKNFENVEFEFETNPYAVVNSYAMANRPYTYYPVSDWKDYGQVLHIKTGYDCYYYDGINKFTFLNSLLLPMGWIWYFKLGKLIIQNRADTIYDILEVDFNETFMEQSLEHNYNQFQLDNVIIEDGSYFDNGKDRTSDLSAFCVFDASRSTSAASHNLSGDTVYVYSNLNKYINKSRPFRDLFIVDTDTYTTTFYNHNFAHRSADSTNDYYAIEEIELDTVSPYNFTKTKYSYDRNKSLILTPYVNSQENSGGFDRNNRNADTGGYYGKGNFFYAQNQPISDSMGLYNGSVANSIFKFVDGQYQNYEQYTNTETFQRNFKKFLKTNDEVILRIDLKTVISDPQQRIQITNYPYADIDGKTFSIVGLNYNERNETTSLTLQMENI